MEPSIQRQGAFWERMRRFSVVLSGAPDLKSLARIILETMTQVARAEKASLFLLNEEKGGYLLLDSIQLKTRPAPPPLLHKEDPLLQYLFKTGEMLFIDQFACITSAPDGAEVPERMNLLEAALTLPLHSKGRLIGMVNLGPGSFSKAPPPEERDFLSVLANLSAMALENRKLGEDLKRSKSHIQRADRLASLGTLTAGLAHELRNPLVAIKTFTQLLPERFDDEEFRNHFLRIVSGEVDRISTLINELLEFARPSDPKVEAENISTILESILFLVSTGAKKKHLHIIKDFSSDLPLVPIDREQIKQVFLNILINAVEATEADGKIYVKTRPYTKSNGESYVQVEVTDTGCGISSESLENIFLPFFTTKHKGSGLGLSISNQIIQDHKGSIDVESQPNKGTTFYVNLPLYPEGLPRRRDFEI